MLSIGPTQHDKRLATVSIPLTVADSIDRTVSFVCRGVILLTSIALLGLLTANVVARYAFDSGGFEFSQELPERLFPWLIMAGVAIAVQEGGHMAIESLLVRLSRGGKRILLLLGHVLVIIAYAVLGWEALSVADIVSIERSPVLGLPSSHSYYALACGCAAVILTTLAVALRVLVLGPEAMPVPNLEETET